MSDFSIDRIYERDADVAIAEELNVSPVFVNWLVKQTGRFKNRKVINTVAFVSLFDSSGETDVTAILTDEDGNRFGLLIENKIDAVLQPNQIQRYFRRGNHGIADSKWAEFAVVMLAPRAYMQRHIECANADAQIAYEDVAAFFRANDPTPRGKYRAAFFQNAAPRGASAYVKIQDDVTNEFWNNAYLLARDEFPILEMRQPNFASRANWVIFRPADLPSRISVELKGRHGFVDLSFSRVHRDRLAEVASPHLPSDMNIQQAAKSAVIRQHSSPFVIAAFENARPMITEGFNRCKTAIEFFRAHRAELTALVRDEIDDFPNK